MAFPLEFPPSPFIRDTAEMFDTGTPSRILDVGCGQGRNSIYLATKGHEVLGVTSEFTDAQSAAIVAKDKGLNTCQFVVGDVRHLPIRKPFDVVLVNEVLQQMPKTHAQNVLGEVRRRTRQGGLNVISGYVVDPERASKTNRERCFGPGELRTQYESSGWDVLLYTEDEFAAQEFGNQQLVHSLAKIVAQRRWGRK